MRATEFLHEDWKQNLKHAALGVGTAAALTLGGNTLFNPKATPEIEQHYENPEAIVLAQTMWGEARGYGIEGMQAVGNVIKNRADAGRDALFGQGIRGVALKPKQFSCWNDGDPNKDKMQQMRDIDRIIRLKRAPDGVPFEDWWASFRTTGTFRDYKAWVEAKRLANNIIAGKSEDPTNGATYYHTDRVRPYWANKLDKVGKIGNHIFYTLPGQDT